MSGKVLHVAFVQLCWHGNFLLMAATPLIFFIVPLAEKE
jgi:hypothetical protein